MKKLFIFLTLFFVLSSLYADIVDTLDNTNYSSKITYYQDSVYYRVHYDGYAETVQDSGKPSLPYKSLYVIHYCPEES